MNVRTTPIKLITFASIIILVTLSCNFLIPEGSDQAPNGPDITEATPTPTPSGGFYPEDPIDEDSVCAGLQGALIAKVLIGPAAAVGLEPIDIATIDFTVSPVEPYVVTGQGQSSSPPQVLTEEWGTYTVSFDMNFTVTGTCIDEGDGLLLLEIDMSGTQLVEVEAEGFHGEYPWSGDHTLKLEFPLESGYSHSSEGWEITLIL
jgi:hypothetical protein